MGGLLLQRVDSSENATWTDKEDHSSYVLQEKEPPCGPSTPVNSPHIKLVYEAGDASAVWSIGHSVLCKVRYIERGITAESETLRFVQRQHPSFDTPRVLRHAFYGNRSFLFLQRLPGKTLDVSWPHLNEFWRRHYVDTVVEICKEMAQWKGTAFGGVDGHNLPEYYLIKHSAPQDFDSTKLNAACEAIGMDCHDIVFYHADLGPQNIIIEAEPSTGRVGVIDFENAGYFPRGWIRTKFRICSGMDLSSRDDPYQWRLEVERALGAQGFEDAVQAWQKWWYS